MLHRNLHMEDIMNLKTSNGTRSGGVFGFLRSLNKAMRNCPSDYYPIICWDSKVAQRRLDLYPNYKHNQERKKDSEYNEISKMLLDDPNKVDIEKYTEEEVSIIKFKMNEMLSNKERFGSYSNPDDYLSVYVSQRNLIIDICSSLGIPNLKYTCWEGDDLMTLLTRVSNKSIIVSDDSDMQQLISDRVSILKVLKDTKFVKLDDIKSYGYPNAHIIAVIKAITGDGSDNVPQVVYRLGPKTAEKIALLMYKNGYDSSKYLEEIKILLKGSTISKFVENHDDYLRNLQLVDLSFVPDDFEVYNYISSIIKNTQVNYFDALAKVSKLEINAVDLESIINRCVMARERLYEV